ncbi:P-loop containing nucleoside triphosphate hydrolase protein [Durotheca rogersii]|uniref:P-loop containing nucleoside triphosphate hydrolase protein n=1 Tax=Durotheca rogersii TaxID=419775 RepID=UPI00221F7490|nr:P-loop containing nucleoside triphosphate hydrolase protein [Durotheca rogersii]KAI5860085.1 P-loop containing nucleoside triphosphate hydrolase protein [Durotheca rogersii]
MMEPEATSAPGASHAPKTYVPRTMRRLIRETLQRSHEDHISRGRLDPRSMLGSQSEVNRFYSNYSVDLNNITANQDFAMWAIDEALREYSPERNFQITGQIMEGQSVAVRMAIPEVPKKIGEAIRADTQHEIDAEEVDSYKDPDYEITQDVGSVAQAFISSSANCLGPPIEACAVYLHMTKCGEYGDNKLTVWKSALFPKLDGQEGRRGFFDSQITAIVWILSRFLGTLPVLKIKDKALWNAETKRFLPPQKTAFEKENRKRLRSPKYRGGILADSMGLGKTMTTIACLDLLASQRLNVEKSEDGKKKYRPMLIVAPSAIVAAQWVDEIEQMASTRGIKKIIVSGNGLEGKLSQRRVISLTPQQFNSAWPRRLQYMWNEDDYNASKTVIVMSIETWSRRTCKVRQDDGLRREYYSSFAEAGRAFSVVVVDEAHKIKNSTTLSWKSINFLERQFTLLITATPCLNTLVDLLALARILWHGPEKYLRKNPQKLKQMDTEIRELHDLETLDSLEVGNDCHLAAGRPSLLLKAICKPGEKAADSERTRKYLKYFDSLAILRRSPSSHIFADWARRCPVSLEGMLPRVDNFTATVHLDHDLEVVYQEVHLKLLKEYLLAAKLFMCSLHANKKEKDGGESKSEAKGEKGKGGTAERKQALPIAAVYRRFQLAAASLDVYNLEGLLGRHGFGTKAEHVLSMRRAKVNLRHLARFLNKGTSPMPRIAVDYIKLAVRASPVLRYILHFVKGNVLKRRPNGKIKKLLITESIPILAYYYELVLQFLLINCQTLHAGLDQDERRELIASFNDDTDESCQILIQMYTVGFAGSNLHKNCDQVLVASQAHSLRVQWQAVHRVIRVGQKSDVKVCRIMINNSFHMFRESRQVEKILPELAARTQGPMSDALVHLLNLFQFEVRDAWESPEGQKLLRDKNLLLFDPVPGEGGSEEAISDEEFLELKTRQEYYLEYKQLPASERSVFSHAKNNLRRTLSYGAQPDGAAPWQTADLAHPAVLERALELMLRVRLGGGPAAVLPLPQTDFSELAAGPRGERRLAALRGLMDAGREDALFAITDQDVDDAVRGPATAHHLLKGAPRASLDGFSLSEIDRRLAAEARFGGGMSAMVKRASSAGTQVSDRKRKKDEDDEEEEKGKDEDEDDAGSYAGLRWDSDNSDAATGPRVKRLKMEEGNSDAGDVAKSPCS